jgi:hypothetical protein
MTFKDFILFIFENLVDFSKTHWICNNKNSPKNGNYTKFSNRKKKRKKVIIIIIIIIFKKKLQETLDIITNSLSHKQIVFQRNESLESGVPYYVFWLTTLELKNIYLLLVSGHRPWRWGFLKNFGALWSLRLQQQQPKIRPHIHNSRASYIQHLYIPYVPTLIGNILFVSSCDDQQCLLCEAKFCHPNLILWLQSATLRYKLQACEGSIIPRRILTSPHFGVYKKRTALNMSHLRPFERGRVL